jgi:UDP-N-acetylmuramyl tripeptide synthase
MKKRSLHSIPAIIVGKTVRTASRISGSGGSAFPGQVVERFDPNFLENLLSKLPYGVVLVTGTNGKTTTTHLIKQILRDQGLKVFSNRTGSNFSRGVASELVKHASIFGSPKADVAVLELDEAYGVGFSKKIQPNVSVFLNVFRDQLDRFGELDYTTKLLTEIAYNTTDVVILNQDDTHVMQIEKMINEKNDNITKRNDATIKSNKDNDEDEPLEDLIHLAHFGVSEKLRSDFITDEELYGKNASNDSEDLSLKKEVDVKEQRELDVVQSLTKAVPFASYVENDNAEVTIATPEKTLKNRLQDVNDVVILDDYEIVFDTDKIKANFSINTYGFEADLGISGIHNALNCAAAISVVRNVLGGKLDGTKLIQSLGKVQTAFGRGESIKFRGEIYDLVLVKNPAGFRLALKSYEPDSSPVMIAINDDYADSRDVSWLYDVDFGLLDKKRELTNRNTGVDLITGRRAFDLQLKFIYENMPAGEVDLDIKNALLKFSKIKRPEKATKKRIYATYTAMLELHKLLRRKRRSTL